MSLILLIETATAVCSVALSRDGEVIAVKEINQRNVHAEVITVYIRSLFETTGETYHQLDAVAVSSGPGSYTGLRIGVSTAKGICFALGIPLIAVDTLKAMANGFAAINNFQSATNNVLLFPMLDARRMEVYTAGFDLAGNCVMPTAAEIIDENSFKDYSGSHQLVFFGDGAAKCIEILRENHNAAFYPDFINSARYLHQIASEKYQQSAFEDVAYFEPFYLKDFIAGKKTNA
jgi:tRNA threonylcarbamoyladenosine biosynthesis protein TsaB